MIFVWAYKFSDTLVVKLSNPVSILTHFINTFWGGLKQILLMNLKRTLKKSKFGYTQPLSKQHQVGIKRLLFTLKEI